MDKFAKIREKILSGTADSNINFAELCQLLEYLGFDSRIRGDHHIFYHQNIPEIINLQPSGKSVKPYQVKQIRTILVKYRLGGTNAD